MASAPVFRLASYLRADAPVESAETWTPAGMTLACFNGEVKKAVNLDTSSAGERIAVSGRLRFDCCSGFSHMRGDLAIDEIAVGERQHMARFSDRADACIRQGRAQ
jgi:hypothetical protein